MNIRTSQPNPYGPEWHAWDADTYDADCDQDGFYSLSPVGWGWTEMEAIADLKEQLEDEA